MQNKSFYIIVISLVCFFSSGLSDQTYGQNKVTTFKQLRPADSNVPNWFGAVRISGLYSFSSFDEFDRKVDAGAGFNIDFLYAVKKNLSLRFSYGRSGVKLSNIDVRTIDPTYIYAKATTPPWPSHLQIYNRKDKLEASHFFVSVQHNTALNNVRANSSMIYGFAGLGLLMNDITREYDLFNDSTSESRHYFEDGFDTRGALQLGLGATYLVIDNIGLDVSAMAILFSGRMDENEIIAPNYSPLYDLRFGLVVMF